MTNWLLLGLALVALWAAALVARLVVRWLHPPSWECDRCVANWERKHRERLSQLDEWDGRL